MQIMINLNQIIRKNFEKFENFLSSYMGKWADGHSFVHQRGCRNINVYRLPKLCTAITLAFIGLST